jgi:hypothetical protein
MRHTEFKWRFTTYTFNGVRLFSLGLFLPSAVDGGLIRLNLVLWSRSYAIELTWVSRPKLRTT